MIGGQEAIKMVYDFLRRSSLSIDEAREIFVRPRCFLGDFYDLPEPLRHALSASASFCDQEFLFTNLTSVRRFTLMPIWKLGSILFSIGLNLRHRRTYPKKQNRRLCQTLFMKISFLFGTVLTRQTARFSKRILNYIRFCKFYKQPFFSALWAYLNIDTKTLCYSYIDSIPIHPALGPIYRCKDISVSSAAMIGIDLLPSSGQLYFVEANFNPALRPERLHLYNGNDPLGYRLIQYSSRRGFKHILLYGPDRAVFDPETEQLWGELATRNGISFEVVDNLFTGHLSYRDAKIEIEFPPYENTLNVLVRGPLNATLATLISEKGNLECLIEDVNRSFPGKVKISVPKRIVSSGDVLMSQRDNRFPNLIVKDRRKDSGSGIKLFNLDKVPKGYDPHDFTISEFVIPDRIKKVGRGRPHEYVYVYRSHILLTTDGPVYLGAHRVRSSVQLPSYAPNGMVEDIRPYVANYSLGGRYEKLDTGEDALCQKASVSIGNIVSRFISQKFILEFQR